MAHSITLQNLSDTDIINNDILGQICFAAPNEAGGTDSILVSASIFARSEGTFAADNNATELVFVTAASESASPGATNYDMTLSSGGNLTLAGNLELGHASDTTIARSSAGVITVEGTEVILAGAVTAITSLLATDIKIGEDAQTAIDFETANEIHFDADNAERVKIDSNGLTMTSGDIYTDKIRRASDSSTTTKILLNDEVLKLYAGHSSNNICTIDSTGLTIDNGSLETATIDYTDGDNAMTIADGGKVTFAAGFAVGSDAAGDILYHNGTSYVRLGIGSDGQVLTVNDAGNAPQWENASGGGSGDITGVTLAGDSGSAADTSGNADITIAGGNGITTSGSSATLTVALDAALTTVTSLLASNIKIGEDDQTKIDFETADEIHFYAANVEQVYLADNIFGPQSDSDVDLGSNSVRWKDAYIDSITTTGKITAGGSINQGITSATEDATVVIDLSSGNYFNITLGANVTDIDFTNGTDGQRFLIRFTQPGGANYSIAYNAVTHDQDGGGSPASVTIKWAGGITHTMTRTNAKADTVGFIINDENAFDGFIVGQNL